MRVLLFAVLAVLIVALIGVPVATGAESPISPPPVYEPTDQELEQERAAKPQPTPYLEMCEVYIPRLGQVELPCKYVDDFLEYWQQLIR